MLLRPRSAPRGTAVLGLLLAGCAGAAPATTTPCATGSPPPSASPSALAGPLRLTASAAAVPAGSALDLVATVTGPARLSVPCAAPAQLIVVDAAGLHVFAASPAASAGERCGDVALGLGESAAYALHWAPDVTLPSGVYDAVVSVGELPPASLAVSLSRRPQEPCA